MLLNPKDCAAFAARRRCGGHPPSRLSPIPPPLFPAVCGFARKVRCFACPWLRLLKLNALRGTSPPPPQSHLRRRGGRGEGAKNRALPPALAAECIFSAGRQGVSIKNRKCKNPHLQFFTDILPLPWQKLLKPGGAPLLDFTGYRADTEKGGNRPSKGEKHVP